jgi:N-acetylgalactosamine kinase
LVGKKFKSIYNKEPLFYARAPGRVNLIGIYVLNIIFKCMYLLNFSRIILLNAIKGEHIDYCGYSVLPMAIEHDIVMAVSLNDDGELRLSNCEPTFKYFILFNKIYSDGHI